MNNPFNTPNGANQDGNGENKHFTGQLITIFNYLHDNVATASMASVATEIPQKNICRYKRDLEKAGRLYEVKRSLCKQTGFPAWYLTTNPDLIPPTIQIDMFD